jgi:hypothetical protein
MAMIVVVAVDTGFVKAGIGERENEVCCVLEVRSSHILLVSF